MTSSPHTPGLRGGAYRLLVPALRALNASLRAVTAASHRLQYKVEGFLSDSAEWFDHEVDVHWQWPSLGRASFLERGVLGALTIRPGAEVLELCCGDGFNAARFYAGRARRVVALDHNEQALDHARRRHSQPNIEYRLADVRDGVTAGPVRQRDLGFGDPSLHARRGGHRAGICTPLAAGRRPAVRVHRDRAGRRLRVLAHEVRRSRTS